jgi:hypothetical protein
LSIKEIPEAERIFGNKGPLEFYAKVDSNKNVEDLTLPEKLSTFDTKYKKQTFVRGRVDVRGLLIITISNYKVISCVL